MSEIRPRKPEDIAACVDILSDVYTLSNYPIQGVDNAAKALSTNGQAWVATDAKTGKVIGHVSLNEPRKGNVGAELWLSQHPDDKIAILGWLFVSPKSRGTGAAKALVRSAEKEARAKGLRVILFALIKDQPAIALYRRLGWDNFGTTVYRWGEGNEMEAECFASPLP